jgi:hypothetical protein
MVSKLNKEQKKTTTYRKSRAPVLAGTQHFCDLLEIQIRSRDQSGSSPEGEQLGNVSSWDLLFSFGQ